MAVPGGRVAALDDPVGLSDMCLLEPLTEDNFLANLHQRFKNDIIYTYIGNVVVSINPYKKLPLYSKDVIFEYRSRNLYELPPHIYAIADDAYRSMRDLNQDQCVIISGESGAGKTEASKVIMQYVAAVSGKGKEIDRVKEQLLQSNPVLEAFGNAKTNKNDNSSRFGKYMDVEFDFKGDPIGGVITNYLLEKSRVSFQNKGERSFHVFYQLLSGADTSFLKALKLHRNPDHYLFLRSGMCTQIESVDDKEDFHVSKFQHMANGFTDSGAVSNTDKSNFEVTTTAMEVIGFKREEITAVFQLLACVLKLGNLQFQHCSNIDGTDGCKLHNKDEVFEVCDLLGCDIDSLLRALTQRTVKTQSENVKTDLSSTEATYARDALCKAVYSRMFTWLVNRINDSIRVKTRGKRKSIGVLDIYGFEIFENNGFEQFIINYCNEKLQQIFIELTLKEEQEEYVREGIEWINVEYFNNAVICDLIEKSNVGILAMLDEECLRPGKVSDLTFLEKLNQTCFSHPHYESRGCRKNQSDRTLPHDAFRLIHYAGAVTYKVEGFLDKNNDLLYRDLSQSMYRCGHPLLKLLFPEGNPARSSLRRPTTAGSQFKVSVGELMKNLLSKCPNYIRCIKPNDYKRPDMFDEQIVKHQVRYLGLMENVRVRRAGYAYRQSYDQFLYRYKMLAVATWPLWQGPPREGVRQVLDELEVSKEEFACGKTKVFIRNPSTLFMMEERRRARLHDLATLLQTIWRGWHQRMAFLRMKRAQTLIACQYRGYKGRTRYQQMRQAAITLCSFVRGWKARKLLKELKYRKRCQWAVGVIHKYYLGWKVRRAYRRKFRAIAGPKIVKFLQRALRYRFLTELSKKLPSQSPIDKSWPSCSPMFYFASEELKVIHHKWRCEKFRASCDKHKRNWMREKVAASDLFHDKKTNYPTSVNHPFKGDYVSLRQNNKWKRIACETNDQHLVFADLVSKVNRTNGKMVHHLLVMSTNAVLVLDQRTLVIKYRIPVAGIDAMALSPYNDKLVLLQLKRQQENGDILTKKGDFLLSSDHVIEIVAKLYLLVQNATTVTPPVKVSNQFTALMNGYNVDLSFKTGMPDVPPGTVKIVRKGSKMDVFEP